MAASIKVAASAARRASARSWTASLLAAAIAALPATGGWANPRRGADARAPAALSLHDAVALAWARLPQRQTFAARQATAAARYAAGSALVPNAPSANRWTRPAWFA